MQRSLQLSGLKGLQQGLTSLAVQRLRLQASTAGSTGSNPGQGTKIPYSTWPDQKKLKNLKKKRKSTDCRNGDNEEVLYSCRRAVGHTRMSSETFYIRIGCRVIPYCEQLSGVLQDSQRTWLSHTKCQ